MRYAELDIPKWLAWGFPCGGFLETFAKSLDNRVDIAHNRDMTTIQLIANDIIEFDAPHKILTTNGWIAQEYAAFRLTRQAGKGRGVYCTLYKRFEDGRMVKATETLKMLKVDETGVWVTFDKPYQVGTVE